MLTGNGYSMLYRALSSRRSGPLPLTALCDMACVDALLHATGRVAVLVGRLPVARPWLLTNEALGGSARGRGHERQASLHRWKPLSSLRESES